MKPIKNAHCSWCGSPFSSEAPWPRVCIQCKEVSYQNPLPVAVALIPTTSGGLLGVRRGIEPRKGEVALPGGFIEVGESWQEACAREVMEELEVELDAQKFESFTTLSAPDGTVLIFGLFDEEVEEDALPPFSQNSEASERVIISPDKHLKLAFDLHTRAAKKFFER